jgi:hypothetical protein
MQYNSGHSAKVLDKVAAAAPFVPAGKCALAITAAVATPEHLHLREVMIFDR